MQDSSEHTDQAWLVNSKGEYTIHRFCGTEPVTLMESDGREYVAIGLLFKCQENGSIRRWGLVSTGRAD